MEREDEVGSSKACMNNGVEGGVANGSTNWLATGVSPTFLLLLDRFPRSTLLPLLLLWLWPLLLLLLLLVVVVMEVMVVGMILVV